MVTTSQYQHRAAGRQRQEGHTQETFSSNYLVVNSEDLGHSGATLIGEIKKGKYVYYRCSHYKTDCNEPYVREEVLEE